jgi:membrane-bound inhibitor of C-type lysozyme
MNTIIEKISLATVLMRNNNILLKESHSEPVGGRYSYSVLFQHWSVGGTCYIYGLISPLEDGMHHNDHR